MRTVLPNAILQWHDRKKQYEQQLVDLAVAEAKAERIRRGRNPAAVEGRSWASGLRSGAVMVDLNGKDLKGDLVVFVTKPIYEQAVRERDRSRKLAAGLRRVLRDFVVREGDKIDGYSAEFKAMLRQESRGVMTDVVGLMAPVKGLLEGAEVSPKIVAVYGVAYEVLKIVLAERDGGAEAEEKVQTALSSFAKISASVVRAVGKNTELGIRLERVATAYDVIGKLALSATAKDREKTIRLLCDVVGVAFPPAAAAKGGFSLLERASRQWVILKTLEGFSDTRRYQTFAGHFLLDKIKKAEANVTTSEGIISLWEAAHPGKGTRP